MKLEQYITKKEIVFCFITTGICTALLSTFAGLEILRFLSGREVETTSAFLHLLLLKLPFLIAISLPVSIFTGIAGVFYIMTLNGELKGTLSIGFNFQRYLIKGIPWFLLISFIHFLFNERVVSYTERTFAAKEASIDKKEVTQKFSNIWIKRGNLFIHIQKILPFEKRAINVEIVELESSRIVKYIRSKEGTIKDGTLVMNEAEVTEFKESGIVEKKSSYQIKNFPLLKGKQKLSESDLFSIPLRECISIIRTLEKEGGSVKIYMNILSLRILLPSLSFISAILGNATPLFANFTQPLSFLISPFIFILIVISLYFSVSLSFKGILPPSIPLFLYLVSLLVILVSFLFSSRPKTKEAL